MTLNKSNQFLKYILSKDILEASNDHSVDFE
jgi:hypothetical protein